MRWNSWKAWMLGGENLHHPTPTTLDPQGPAPALCTLVPIHSATRSVNSGLTPWSVCRVQLAKSECRAVERYACRGLGIRDSMHCRALALLAHGAQNWHGATEGRAQIGRAHV